MVNKDNEKCREWERRRRDRLSDAFKCLVELLPNYDPAKIPPKIDILENSTQFIKELRLSNSRLLTNQTEPTEMITKVKNLQDEVNKLILRVKQLTALLVKAKIPIPTGPYIKSLGRKRLKWSNKLRGENIENIQTPTIVALPTPPLPCSAEKLDLCRNDTSRKTRITVVEIPSSKERKSDPKITEPPSCLDLDSTLNKSSKENLSSTETLAARIVAEKASPPKPVSVNSQPLAFFLAPIQQTQFLTPFNLTTSALQLHQQSLLPKITISSVQKIPIRPIKSRIPLKPKKRKVVKPKLKKTQKKGKEFGTQTVQNESKVNFTEDLAATIPVSTCPEKMQESNEVSSNTAEAKKANATEMDSAAVDSYPILNPEPPSPKTIVAKSSTSESKDEQVQNEEVKGSEIQSQYLLNSESAISSRAELQYVNSSESCIQEQSTVAPDTGKVMDFVSPCKENECVQSATKGKEGGPFESTNVQNEIAHENIATASLQFNREQILTKGESTVVLAQTSDAEKSESHGAKEKIQDSKSASKSNTLLHDGYNSAKIPDSVETQSVSSGEIFNTIRDNTLKNALRISEDPLSTISTDKISECIARSIGLIEHSEESELLELETTDWGDVVGEDTQSQSPKSPISPTQMFLSMFPLLPRESIEPPPAPHAQSGGGRQPSTNRSSFYIHSMLPDESNPSTPSHFESIITWNTVAPLPFGTQSTPTPPPNRVQEVKSRNSTDSLDTIFAPLQNMRDKRNTEILSLASFLNLDSSSSSKKPSDENISTPMPPPEKKRLLTPLQPVVQPHSQQPQQKLTPSNNSSSVNSFFQTSANAAELGTQKSCDHFQIPTTQILPSFPQPNFVNLESKSRSSSTSSLNYSYFSTKQNYEPMIPQTGVPSQPQHQPHSRSNEPQRVPDKKGSAGRKTANQSLQLKHTHSKSSIQSHQPPNPLQKDGLNQNPKQPQHLPNHPKANSNTGRSRNQHQVADSSTPAKHASAPYPYPVQPQKQDIPYPRPSFSNPQENPFQSTDFQQPQLTNSYNNPQCFSHSYSRSFHEPTIPKENPFYPPPQSNQPKTPTNQSQNQTQAAPAPFPQPQSAHLPNAMHFSNFDFYNHPPKDHQVQPAPSSYHGAHPQQKRPQDYAQSPHYSPTQLQNPVVQNNQRFVPSHPLIPEGPGARKNHPSFNSQPNARANSSVGQRPVNWMTDSPYKKDNTNTNPFSVSKLVGGPASTSRVPLPNPPSHCAESLIRTNTTPWNEFQLTNFSQPSAEPAHYQQQPRTHPQSNIIPATQNDQLRQEYLYPHAQQQHPPQPLQQQQNHYDRNFQQFEHMPHPSYPHQQHQNHQLGTSGGSSSISNFNLSSIFPEINDKRQGNINTSNCNYYPNRK